MAQRGAAACLSSSKKSSRTILSPSLVGSQHIGAARLRKCRVLVRRDRRLRSRFKLIEGIASLLPPAAERRTWRGRLSCRVQRGTILGVCAKLEALERAALTYDVLANPPDLIFVVGAFYKFLLGNCIIFYQHDISPELYEEKLDVVAFSGRVMVLLERVTFALVPIDSNKPVISKHCP